MPKVDKLVNRQAVGTYQGKLHSRQSGLYGKGKNAKGERAGADPVKDEPKPNGKVNYIHPSLKALIVDAGKLVIDPNNARLHPERSISGLKDSLRAFGQRKPIVVRKGSNVVVAGNGTLEAARQLGWTKIAATVQQMTDVEAAAYALADNRLSELSRWDFETVARLEKLVAEAQMPMAGWSEQELSAMRKQAEPVVEELETIPKAVELLEKWQVKFGQAWVIEGKVTRHRLVCGDAKSKTTIALALGDKKATCVFTDPPYGVSVGDKNKMLNTFQPAGRCLENIEADTMSAEDLRAYLVPIFVNVRKLVMSDECSLFVTSPQGGELFSMMMMMMVEAGLPTRHVLIWRKNQPTFSLNRLDYDYQHEPILFTWGKRHKKREGGTHKTSVWDVAKPRASAEHPTMKPVELVVNAILNHTDQGDVVFDPFLGSGTTLIAAEQTGRTGIGIELDPGYCAVALERLANLGLEPKLEKMKKPPSD